MAKRSMRAKKIVLMATLCGVIAFATYTLLAALTPAVKGAVTNPNNNATTERLANTAHSPHDAWLYIPKINVSVPYGTTENSLLTGALWRKPANGNPRDGGNFVLAAHRFVMDFTPSGTVEKSPFYNISSLSVGDTITVDYSGTRYEYRVSEKRTVKPEAVDIENRTSRPQLTLYSCTLAGSQDGRDVIIATPL